MALTFGTPVKTSTVTNTSPAAALVETTAGAVNGLAVSANSTGTGVQPAIATPSGWTLAPGTGVWKSGSPSHEIAVFVRAFVAGDATSQAVSIGAAGGGNIVVVPFAFSAGMIDTTTPIVTGESSGANSAGPTTVVTPALTLAAARYVLSVFGNRSGTWTAATDGNVHDTIQVQDRVTSAASIAVCYGGATTSSGAARSLTSSASTSVHNSAIVAFNLATAPTNNQLAAGAVSWVGTCPVLAIESVTDGSGPPAVAWAAVTARSLVGVTTATPAGGLVWAGTAARTAVGVLNPASTAAVAWSGVAGRSLIGVVQGSSTGAVSWVGTAASTAAGAPNQASAAAVSWTGTAARTVVGAIQGAGPAAVIWVGASVQTLTTIPQNVTPGALAWAGTSAATVVGSVQAGAAGGVVWTATAAATSVGVVHQPRAAAVVWVGTSASLTPAVVSSTGPAALGWTGAAASTAMGVVGVLSPAAAAWTGTVARTVPGVAVITGPGALVWAGTRLSPSPAQLVPVGALYWAGTTAQLAVDVPLAGRPGSTSWAGTAATSKAFRSRHPKVTTRLSTNVAVTSRTD